MNRDAKTFVILSIVLTTVIAFILGVAVGAGSQGFLSLKEDNLASWVTALSTLCIAILTIVLARETWKLRDIQISQIEQVRKDGIKPIVNFTMKPAKVSTIFMNAHNRNDGVGVAQNIALSFVNANLEAQDVFDHIVGELKKIVMFDEGLTSLPPGDEKLSYVFRFPDIHAKFGEKTMQFAATVEVTYQDLEGHSFKTANGINFREYIGASELGEEPFYDMASSLKKIQGDVNKIASGHRRLRADVFDSEDRQKEAEYREQQRIERVEQQENRADGS
jgi:hypothetical protein